MKDSIIQELKEHGLFYIAFFSLNCIIDVIFDRFNLGYIIAYLIAILLLVITRVIVNYNKNNKKDEK